MTIDAVRLNAYLAKVSREQAPPAAHATLMRFMCWALPLVQDRLPAVGQHALESARSFWLEGQGTPELLVEARIACWDYLDQKGRSVDIGDDEDAAMRALLCVLHAESDTDDFASESVRWFADMLDRLDDYSNELGRLMAM